MPETLETLQAAARRWMAEDPDPETRAETAALLQDGDMSALQACFSSRLEFGTAGLRGRLGPGPGSMNRALVRIVSAGLGIYVSTHVEDAAERGVVIGYDGRKNSRVFAEDTAAVLGALGLKVTLFDEVCATPVLSHAVVFLKAAAGVMVTASHNPAQDNGYKVYWENGAQIIPPQDRGISEAIDKVHGASSVNLGDLVALRAAGLLRSPPAAAWTDYATRVLSDRVHHDVGVRAVYTAMHGVGWAPLERLVALSGHDALIPVPEQRDPDPDFPTVAFPNPEEPGALNMALALAASCGAELLLANDPDADRLAVAIPDDSPASKNGGWRVLTGNEVGILLADDRLTHGPQGPERLVATSLVSTSLLRRIAAAHGVHYAETLTGFKWIANAAINYSGRFVMGFEEALGYSLGPVVRDKDGVSAALAMLDLAAWCKSRGVTMLAHLESVYRRYGYASAGARSITLPGLDGSAQIRAMMAALRADPPTRLGGVPVGRVRDLARGLVRNLESGEESPSVLPPSDVLAFDLIDGGRVLARPSGTEPKIKFYSETIETFGEGETLADVEARGKARAQALLVEIVAAAQA